MKIFSFVVVALTACSDSNNTACQGDNCQCSSDIVCEHECSAGATTCFTQCAAQEPCDVTCGSSQTCNVQAQTSPLVTVDCGTSTCAVQCPANNCTVKNCGTNCTVMCGPDDTTPTRTGTTATCP